MPSIFLADSFLRLLCISVWGLRCLRSGDRKVRQEEGRRAAASDAPTLPLRRRLMGQLILPLCFCLSSGDRPC